jgi:uncharacterized protein (TIGR02271 family)
MATRTITALFASREAAERARTQLAQLSLPVDAVQIIEQDGGVTASATSYTEHGHGLWARIKEMFVPDEDREIYAEGVRRGQYLLYARADESEADEVIAAIESCDPIDVEEQQKQWQSEGWRPGAATSASLSDTPVEARAPVGSAATGERIPVVEERLRVGKREVNRGGVRVRAYAVEEPVREEVRLREEHIDIERRPVNQPITSAAAADDLLKDRTIEMTETAEEAVVAKEARVKEELVVSKRADEQVRKIDNTVRHTEIDLDRDGNLDTPVTGKTVRSDDQPPRRPRN